MNKDLMRRDALDFFTPFFEVGRKWDEVVRRQSAGERMINPAVDIVEDEDGLTLQVELPGLKKDEVKITIEDGVLSLSGEKKFVTEEKKRDYHRVERRYGAFHRSFTLPSGIDAGNANARFEDGVLTIAMPKSESAKPRELQIA